MEDGSYSSNEVNEWFVDELSFSVLIHDLFDTNWNYAN